MKEHRRHSSVSSIRPASNHAEQTKAAREETTTRDESRSSRLSIDREKTQEKEQEEEEEEEEEERERATNSSPSMASSALTDKRGQERESKHTTHIYTHTHAHRVCALRRNINQFLDAV